MRGRLVVAALIALGLLAAVLGWWARGRDRRMGEEPALRTPWTPPRATWVT